MNSNLNPLSISISFGKANLCTGHHVAILQNTTKAQLPNLKIIGGSTGDVITAKYKTDRPCEHTRAVNKTDIVKTVLHGLISCSILECKNPTKNYLVKNDGKGKGEEISLCNDAKNLEKVEIEDTPPSSVSGNYHLVFDKPSYKNNINVQKFCEQEHRIIIKPATTAEDLPNLKVTKKYDNSLIIEYACDKNNTIHKHYTEVKADDLYYLHGLTSCQNINCTRPTTLYRFQGNTYNLCEEAYSKNRITTDLTKLTKHLPILERTSIDREALKALDRELKNLYK